MIQKALGKHSNTFIVLHVFKTNMAVKLSIDERKWLLKCYWKAENVEVQICWRVEFDPPPTRATITRIRDKFEVDGMSWKVNAEEREVPLITRVLMQPCRFLHDPQRSHSDNVLERLVSRIPAFIEFCDQIEHAITDIPVEIIQTVCRSVRRRRRRRCECTVEESGHYEHVRV